MMEVESSHVTKDMALLIKRFADAKVKDELMVAQFRKIQDKERKKWFSLSDDEREKLTLENREFKELPTPPSKWVRALRREIRYRLFRIREGNIEYDKGLKKWMELQFRSGMNWKNFTFEWDVSSNEPLKVIEPMEWDGKMIYEPSSKKKVCDPIAFTKQEM